jgi:hypothetical protein
VAEISEQTTIANVGHRLTTMFPAISPDEVSRIVHQAHASFEQSPIREFVPLLVERRARAELSRAALPPTV